MPRAVAPPIAAWLAAALVVALLALAPPVSNLAWGVNGLRSIGVGSAALIVTGAAALAWLALRPRVPGAALALAGAAVLAFPLRERLHLLGDTLLRLRQVETVLVRPDPQATFLALSGQLHAQPLDALIGIEGVLALAGAGIRPTLAFSLISCALALAAFAGLARLARRVAPGAGVPAVAALALAGTLEAFAGYGESAGLLLAAGAWWWATLLSPLRHRRDAARAALAWAALFLSHRVALLALVPQLARAALPALEGDTRGGRRAFVGFTLVAAAGATVWTAATGRGTLGRDALDFVHMLPGARGGAWVPPADLVNLLLVAMPQALLVPWFAGRAAMAGVLRTTAGRLHLVALVPLLPLLLVFPAAPAGLGAHRDWDLATLPALVASSLAVAALARLEEPRRRGAWALLLPVLALGAGAWLAVNADEGASRRRAEALADGPHGLRGEQRGHVLEFLGYSAADAGRNAEAARRFDESFAELPNARNALVACEAWLRAGDPVAARRSLERARAKGRLPPALEQAAQVLERSLGAAEARRSAAPPGR